MCLSCYEPKRAETVTPRIRARLKEVTGASGPQASHIEEEPGSACHGRATAKPRHDLDGRGEDPKKKEHTPVLYLIDVTNALSGRLPQWYPWLYFIQDMVHLQLENGTGARNWDPMQF